MDSSAGEIKGGLFPSARSIRTSKQSQSEEGQGTSLTWLTNQSFDPQIAQANAHCHGDRNKFNQEQLETNVTTDQPENHSYQNLSIKLPQPTVNEEFIEIYEHDPSSLAKFRGDVVVTTEKNEKNEASDGLQEQSDSDSVSSDGDLQKDNAASTVRVESYVKQEPRSNDKKPRSRDDYYRHKKSKKRHHRSDSSSEREKRKHHRSDSSPEREKRKHHRSDSSPEREKRKHHRTEPSPEREKRKHHRTEPSPEREKRKHRKKKSKHKDDRGKKKHKDEREKKPKESKELKSHKARPSSIWIDDIGFVPETPFYVDEKSDRNNLCFKSLNYTDLAFYRRLGTSCLGLDSEKQKVEWGEGKDKKKGKKHSGNSKRYFEHVCADDDVEKIPAAKRMNDQSERMDRTLETSRVEMTFIPVKPSIDISTNDQSVADRTAVQGREASETDGNGLLEAIAIYNKHLHDNPADIAKWLEFVRFQDQAFQSTHNSHVLDGQKSSMSIKTSKREQLILEKKLSILEKALKVNPLNAELQLEQMELCRETWELGKLSRQWDSIIRQHSENLRIWKQYLAFTRSSFSKFTVSSVATLYSRYMNAMEAQDTAVKLDIVIQVCHFWRQSGHTEKAVALLQALVEFNCFCPEQVKESTTLEGKIAFFEPFLDSNEPRFGQPDAKGWSKWVEHKEKGGWSNQSKDSKVNDDNESVINKTHLEWQAWLEEEVYRDHAHFLPWQPAGGQTEDDCEDPERMVLVDDITPFLFNLDSVDLKFELILRFLDFLGVRRQELLSCLHNSAQENLEHPAEMFGFGAASSRGGCGGGLAMSGEGLPDMSQIAGDRREARSSGGYDQNKALLRFADDVITQAATLFPPEAKNHLTLLQLRYNLQRMDSSASPKQQRKRQKEGQRYAKRLLGQECNRNSLSLWEEYAKWEWHNGNKVESQRIFETALAFSNLNSAAEEDELEGITKLLSTYAVLKLGIHQQNPTTNPDKSDAVPSAIPCRQEVLHALTTLGEGGKFTPFCSMDKHVSAGRILKARRGYVELYKKATDSSRDTIHSCHVRLFTCLDQQGSQLVHIVLCYALFQYLSVGMQAARVVFEETLLHYDGLLNHVESTMDEVEKGTVHHQLAVDAELTMLHYTQLVSHHVHSNPMPVTSLRNLMQRALRRYGNNPELLRSLIDLEARSHIAGRLRRYFDKATSEAAHPIPWLYAIYAELDRLQRVEGEYLGKDSGITHRLRSLFDRASSNRHTRHCVLLWRLYILFEVQHGDPKRGKAIFYRALQHCPWAKILYMDAVRYFPEELQELLDLLMEKELRVRAPIEEVQLLMKVAQNKKD